MGVQRLFCYSQSPLAHPYQSHQRGSIIGLMSQEEMCSGKPSRLPEYCTAVIIHHPLCLGIFGTCTEPLAFFVKPSNKIQRKGLFMTARQVNENIEVKLCSLCGRIMAQNGHLRMTEMNSENRTEEKASHSLGRSCMK